MNYQEEQIKLLKSIDEKLSKIIDQPSVIAPHKKMKKKNKTLSYSAMADKEFKKMIKR